MNNIKMKLVNSVLAGLLVTLGGCASGEMSWSVIYFSLIAGLIVAVSQFRDALSKIPEAEGKAFSFV